jgi:hypothetical protein
MCARKVETDNDEPTLPIFQWLCDLIGDHLELDNDKPTTANQRKSTYLPTTEHRQRQIDKFFDRAYRIVAGSAHLWGGGALMAFIHHDGKSAQAGEGGECTPIPFYCIFCHIQNCSVLQVREQIHSDYFYSTPICTLWQQRKHWRLGGHLIGQSHHNNRCQN